MADLVSEERNDGMTEDVGTAYADLGSEERNGARGRAWDGV